MSLGRQFNYFPFTITFAFIICDNHNKKTETYKIQVSLGQSYMNLRLRKLFWLKYRAVNKTFALKYLKMKFLLLFRKKWCMCGGYNAEWRNRPCWLLRLDYPAGKARRVTGCNEFYQEWVVAIYLMISLGPYLSHRDLVSIEDQHPQGWVNRWRTAKPSHSGSILYMPAPFHVPTHPPLSISFDDD